MGQSSGMSPADQRRTSYRYAAGVGRCEVITLATPRTIRTSGMGHHQCSQKAARPCRLSRPAQKTPSSTNTPPDPEFTAFHQEDMSSTRLQGGFGLGLFLASRLCQACDGDLSVMAVGGRTVAEARFLLR